jgi:small-conductance mechanosensitive channel/CRP-like cAMP-binding protein
MGMTLGGGATPLLPFDVASAETLGVVVAILLLVALRLTLPAPLRRLVRQPALFLILHLGARLLLQVLPEGAGAQRGVALAALVLLLASIGRSAVLLLLDVGLGQRLARPLPKIIRDIAQGLVYLAILFTALRTAGVEPGSILTTSALLTAVIALSLQETLGNMVAGLAIQMQRPFDVGDWIQFDGEAKHIGKVVEINWRATKICSLDDVEITVPNSTLAKAPIVNYTKPDLISRRSLYVQAPADVPPHKVHRAILDALVGSFGIVESPAPSVVTNAFVEGNVEYWIRFFTDQFDKRDGVDGAARDRVWYALTRAGIPPAFPNRNVALHEVSPESRAKDEARRVSVQERTLRNVDFLRALSAEQMARLAAESNMRLYAPGEPIVRQGDESAEMFIVESGEVVVLHERTNGRAEVELARLGPGKFFGEMALMTGEPRNATVRAATACTLIRVDHRALKLVLESAPELTEHVSRVIAERQAATTEQGAAASGERRAGIQEQSSQLLSRIRRFFSLS